MMNVATDTELGCRRRVNTVIIRDVLSAAERTRDIGPASRELRLIHNIVAKIVISISHFVRVICNARTYRY